ncbi:Putative electron transport protein YccM [Burkholderiales bacterium]|nr:Putative electron transport protein YccM [Burkholderiales bacterium]
MQRVFGLLLAFWFAGLALAADLPSVYPQARSIFPEADGYSGFEGLPQSVAVYKDGKVVGYLFLTEDVIRIPAYSGKPINTMVGIDLQGRIVGLAIVHHDEPILAVGITQERLNRYTEQYVGKSAFDRIVIGGKRDGHVAIDGISGATITVMVQNSTVMRAARAVAEVRGIRSPAAPAPAAATQDSRAAPVAPIETRPTAPPTPPELAAPATLSSTPAPAPPAPGPSSAEVAAPKAAAPRIEEPARLPPAASTAAPTKVPAPTKAATPAGAARGTGEASRQLVHGVVPLSPEMPPRKIAPLPEKPGTWTPPKEEPAWVAIWQSRSFEIAILVIGLAVLSFVLVFQDWLAHRAVLLNWVRYGFHFYTLFFIGWWGLAQLSVMNVLTFVGSVMSGFDWEHFLIDPMLFILWGFVAVTLLLWGRGVYCGWLCPFGALQELILAAGRKLKLPEIEFSDAVHERLVALKYIILILLFGVSLQSISEVAIYAEIEPFKTVIAMRFQREWPYVVFALVLLALAAVNRKFYCKYLCPLGAALAIPGRFRLFEWWLRRRKECGKPCQVCANRCSVRAMRATGEINANECHYGLDCQVIYYNDRMCLPLIDRRKRREAQLQRVGAALAAGESASPPQAGETPVAGEVEAAPRVS